MSMSVPTPERSTRAMRTCTAAAAAIFGFAVLTGAVHAQTANGSGRVSVGRWSFTGSLNESRGGHTATLLANGKVLVGGGYVVETPGDINGCGPCFLDSAELYDPPSGNWSTTGHLNTARSNHTATLLADGRVLVVGGYAPDARGQGMYLDSAELYDPATGVWTMAASTAVPRYISTATLLHDGRVLVVGGLRFASETPLDSAELYDPVTGKWSVAATPGFPRSSHTATLLSDGRVLVAGGFVSSYDPDIQFPEPSYAEVYDPRVNRWSTVGSTPIIMYEHSAALVAGDRVLLAGGYGAEITSQGTSYSPSLAKVFDVSSGVWTNSTLSFRQQGTLTRLADGKVMLTGNAALAQVFDPISGRWTPVVGPNAQRYAATATMLSGGVVLVAGGVVQAPPPAWATLSSAELFDPGAEGVAIGPAFTGAWYDPSQSGHGIFLEILPNNQIYLGWFGFNPAGTQQAWFGGVGTYSRNVAVIGTVDMPTGGKWIPNFNPNAIAHNPWGSMALTFSDCNHGRVDFSSTLGYGSGGMDLTRLTQPLGFSCP